MTGDTSGGDDGHGESTKTRTLEQQDDAGKTSSSSSSSSSSAASTAGSTVTKSSSSFSSSSSSSSSSSLLSPTKAAKKSSSSLLGNVLATYEANIAKSNQAESLTFITNLAVGGAKRQQQQQQRRNSLTNVGNNTSTSAQSTLTAVTPPPLSTCKTVKSTGAVTGAGTGGTGSGSSSIRQTIQEYQARLATPPVSPCKVKVSIPSPRRKAVLERFQQSQAGATPLPLLTEEGQGTTTKEARPSLSQPKAASQPFNSQPPPTPPTPPSQPGPEQSATQPSRINRRLQLVHQASVRKALDYKHVQTLWDKRIQQAAKAAAAAAAADAAPPSPGTAASTTRQWHPWHLRQRQAQVETQSLAQRMPRRSSLLLTTTTTTTTTRTSTNTPVTHTTAVTGTSPERSGRGRYPRQRQQQQARLPRESTTAFHRQTTNQEPTTIAAIHNTLKKDQPPTEEKEQSLGIVQRHRRRFSTGRVRLAEEPAVSFYWNPNRDEEQAVQAMTSFHKSNADEDSQYNNNNSPSKQKPPQLDPVAALHQRGILPRRKSTGLVRLPAEPTHWLYARSDQEVMQDHNNNDAAAAVATNEARPSVKTLTRRFAAAAAAVVAAQPSRDKGQSSTSTSSPPPSPWKKNFHKNAHATSATPNDDNDDASLAAAARAGQAAAAQAEQSTIRPDRPVEFLILPQNNFAPQDHDHQQKQHAASAAPLRRVQRRGSTGAVPLSEEADSRLHRKQRIQQARRRQEMTIRRERPSVFRSAGDEESPRQPGGRPKASLMGLLDPTAALADNPDDPKSYLMGDWDHICTFAPYYEPKPEKSANNKDDDSCSDSSDPAASFFSMRPGARRGDSFAVPCSRTSPPQESSDKDSDAENDNDDDEDDDDDLAASFFSMRPGTTRGTSFAQNNAKRASKNKDKKSNSARNRKDEVNDDRDTSKGSNAFYSMRPGTVRGGSFTQQVERAAPAPETSEHVTNANANNDDDEDLAFYSMRPGTTRGTSFSQDVGRGSSKHQKSNNRQIKDDEDDDLAFYSMRPGTTRGTSFSQDVERGVSSSKNSKDSRMGAVNDGENDHKSHSMRPGTMRGTSFSHEVERTARLPETSENSESTESSESSHSDDTHDNDHATSSMRPGTVRGGSFSQDLKRAPRGGRKNVHDNDKEKVESKASDTNLQPKRPGVKASASFSRQVERGLASFDESESSSDDDDLTIKRSLSPTPKNRYSKRPGVAVSASFSRQVERGLAAFDESENGSEDDSTRIRCTPAAKSNILSPVRPGTTREQSNPKPAQATARKSTPAEPKEAKSSSQFELQLSPTRTLRNRAVNPEQPKTVKSQMTNWTSVQARAKNIRARTAQQSHDDDDDSSTTSSSSSSSSSSSTVSEDSPRSPRQASLVASPQGPGLQSGGSFEKERFPSRLESADVSSAPLSPPMDASSNHSDDDEDDDQSPNGSRGIHSFSPVLRPGVTRGLSFERDQELLRVLQGMQPPITATIEILDTDDDEEEYLRGHRRHHPDGNDDATKKHRPSIDIDKEILETLEKAATDDEADVLSRDVNYQNVVGHPAAHMIKSVAKQEREHKKTKKQASEKEKRKKKKSTGLDLTDQSRDDDLKKQRKEKKAKSSGVEKEQKKEKKRLKKQGDELLTSKKDSIHKRQEAKDDSEAKSRKSRGETKKEVRDKELKKKGKTSTRPKSPSKLHV